MNNYCDNLIDLVSKKIKEENIENYTSTMPMLRIQDGKLYLSTLVVKDTDNVWDINSKIIPSYWTLIDIDTNEILEFNKISENNFIKEKQEDFNLDTKKQISKYEIKKQLQYKNYLLEDIKNDQLPILDEVIKLLNNEITINNEKINANDYLIANIEEEINKKVLELVDLVVKQKYSYINIYYEQLLLNIIKEYKKTNIINKEKMYLASKIMYNYYEGILGISNLFNIG